LSKGKPWEPKGDGKPRKGNVGGKFAAQGRKSNKAAGGKRAKKSQKTAQFGTFGEVDGDEDAEKIDTRKKKQQVVKVRSPLEIAAAKTKK